LSEQPSVLEAACVIEGDYVPHTAAMLHSLLTSSSDVPVRVHYLHGPDFPPDDARLLTGMVEQNGGLISFVPVPEDILEGLPTEGFTGGATWYRIFLPDLLSSLSRVLFLDADLIVRHSLRALWEIDLGGNYVAGVTNVLPRHYEKLLVEAGFDTRSYFNAGVLLMDLERMRRDGCTEAMRSYGVEHADTLVVREQDTLNAVLGERRLALEPRWNCMNSFFVYPWAADHFDADQLAKAKADPVIRHFEGPLWNKPWHYLCEWESRHLYAEHRTDTPWPKFRPEGRTPRAMVTRLRRRLRSGRAAPAG
jgi:lipopolysaccharide biosynthesis glycosyltransferase